MSTALDDPGLDQLVHDLEEAVVALAASGVAVPDPDLEGDLGVLADRARRAGCAGAATRAEALAVVLRALNGTDAPDRRRALARDAFDAMQRVVAWVRVFRAGRALEVVKGRLRDASTDVAARQRGVDLDVWPVGAERSGGRWLVHCLAEDATWVVLGDDLGELDANDPFGSPVASRLFQGPVVPRDVLTGCVALREHPVVRSGNRVVARPAFHTRPTLRDRGQGPELVVVHAPGTQHGPVRLVLTVDGHPGEVGEPGRWRWVAASGQVSVPVEGQLERALRRRAAWQGGSFEVEVTAVARGAGVAVIGWRDSTGGPTVPSLDPRAERWPADALSERLAVGELGPVAVAALTLAVGAEHHEVPAASEGDLQLGFRRSILCALSDVPVAAIDAAELFVARGARGEDTFGLLWPAVWLVLEAGRADGVSDELVALAEARRAVPIRSEDDWDEICLRARLIAHGDRDDPQPSVAAAAFVEAHLSSLRRQVGEGRVPSALSLWAVAQTRARVRRAPAGVGVVRSLALDLDVLRDALDVPLSAWLRSEADPDLAEVDALILMAAADLGSDLLR